MAEDSQESMRTIAGEVTMKEATTSQGEKMALVSQWMVISIGVKETIEATTSGGALAEESGVIMDFVESKDATTDNGEIWRSTAAGNEEIAKQLR